MAMDSFFISHGPPSLAIDEFNPATLFMKSWKQNVLPQTPKSILLISAHWETDVPTVNVVERNETIYDFYGFPRSMYQLKYPSPGAPELAKKVKELLLSSGFQRVKEDKTRGLDHGAWVPLMFMYPEANIPVCQLSLQTKMDGTYHYNLGKALAPLRDEGVLIIGSGSTTHNSRVPQILDGSIAPWAQQFDTWLKESLCNGRHQDVNEYDKKAPNGKIAHPTPEHFYPLHVALGAAGPTAKAELVHQSWDYDQEKDLMDTFFISHGSPAMSIDDSIPARHFLKSWQQTIITSKQQQPTAILVISAHWETSDPTVNIIHNQNSTIHDFHNFPKPMYQLKYPAPGAPKLAMRVKELLTQAGFPRVKEDKTRGLDHGAWVPLMLMYPEAEIPVCQLSVQTELDGTHHYNMGKALAPLRDEGVLIIGSGNATHNLRALGRDEDPVPSWAFQFDTWLKESLLNGRYEDINHYEEKAPQPKMNHPSPEHFYPLHVALGAAGETAKAQLIHHSWCEASLSYDSYRFSTSTAPQNNNNA